jgi:hypothetical protein
MGCLGTEDRWPVVWDYARRDGAAPVFLEIHDPDSPLKSAHEAAIAKERGRAASLEIPDDAIVQLALLARGAEIQAVVQRLAEGSGESVLLDLSCLPKRYAFPLLRTLLSASHVRNLAIAYTFPQSHGPILGLDYEECSPLPLFGREYGPSPLLLVSIGYELHGLVQLVGAMPPETEIQFLMPVGGSPTSAQRSWAFLKHLWDDLPAKWQQTPLRIDPRDLSGTYALMEQLAGGRAQDIVFAPYGPKTVSAAMCILASQRDSCVFYSQPTYYDPAYSTGILTLPSGAAASYAYCLRLEGQNLF